MTDFDRNQNGLTTSARGRSLRPKKVLFFGKTKARTRCTGALVDALRAHDLEVCWLNCSFLKRYFTKPGMRLFVRWMRHRFDPDLCFVFYHDLPRVLMDEFTRLVPTVVWMEEQSTTDDEHVKYVRDATLLCLSTPRLVLEYRERGVNSTFMLSGFSPRYHQPVTLPPGARPDRDVAFIGGPGHMGDRPEFLAWLSKHCDVEIFGRVDSWLPYLRKYPSLRYARELRAADYGDVCARSRILMGLNQDHDSAFYFSNRLFLTLGCRGFHLIRHVPGIEELFHDGGHLAWFRDRDECLDKIAHYVAHPEERVRIAAAGYELAMKRHRYYDRVTEILAILAGEKDVSCPVLPSRSVLEPVGAPPSSAGARSFAERPNVTVERSGIRQS